jgi:tRNA (uracil-5-)-methyltransferase TRM9
MNPATVDALLALNRIFYDKFAGDFARTRRSSPPGYDLIVPFLLSAANVFDLGCGNGRLLRFLASRGWRGAYWGTDSSAGLLAEARRAAEETGIIARFTKGDLMREKWPIDGGHVRDGDALVMLAVLHHIPGHANRLRIMAHAAELLAPGGRYIVSTWQFVGSERLRKRLLPWSAAGLSEQDVEVGDYLMSWGEGATGQRYVAAIGRNELVSLAEAARLQTVAIFSTDGLEGDLNLYGVFERQKQNRGGA